MDLIVSLISWFAPVFESILAFIVVLSVLVFFHELGHFSVARLFGVVVRTISLGFGPEMFGWYDKRGTRWRVSWIPLGGYVSFQEEEENLATKESDGRIQESGYRIFADVSPFIRFAIVLAGPMASLLLSVLIFSVLLMTVGERSKAPIIDRVLAGSPAEKAGILEGDLILRFNGVSMDSMQSVSREVALSELRPVPIVIRRADQEMLLEVTPDQRLVRDEIGRQQRKTVIGIQWVEQNRPLVRLSLFAAVDVAVRKTIFLSNQVIVEVYRAVFGNAGWENFSGPVRIAQISGEKAKRGLIAFVDLMAVLSISIGILNLLPLPLLDGGHLVLYAVEMIRGKGLDPKTRDWIFAFGVVLFFVLVTFFTWQDVSRL